MHGPADVHVKSLETVSSRYRYAHVYLTLPYMIDVHIMMSLGQLALPLACSIGFVCDHDRSITHACTWRRGRLQLACMASDLECH